MSNPIIYARLLKRQYPHMTHLSEAVPCPFCAADAGEPCRTKTGGTSYPHSDRGHAFTVEAR